jgi:hypothetical protein
VLLPFSAADVAVVVVHVDAQFCSENVTDVLSKHDSNFEALYGVDALGDDFRPLPFLQVSVVLFDV